MESHLKAGADPNGIIIDTEGYSDNLYGFILEDCYDDEAHWKRLPIITEILLKYGLDISNPRIPYDGDNVFHPFDQFAFEGYDYVTCLQTMKLFLDSGLPANEAAECWEHAMFDWYNLGCYLEDADAPGYIDMARKMLFISSYPHVLTEDKRLQEAISLSDNSYDPTHFQNIDDYEFKLNIPANTDPSFLRRAMVSVIEKSTGRTVWNFTP